MCIILAYRHSTQRERDIFCSIFNFIVIILRAELSGFSFVTKVNKMVIMTRNRISNCYASRERGIQCTRCGISFVGFFKQMNTMEFIKETRIYLFC